jgi:integrase
MGMTRNRLTDVAVRNTRKPGMHLDGGGLYLRVASGGSKGWIFRYRSNGRLHDMGLGPLSDVRLAEARKKAARLRQQRLDGIDPLVAKRAARSQALIEAAKGITFDAACAAFIAANEAGWRNAKHRWQWSRSLEMYASPIIGRLPVAAIDTGLLMQVIEPIWSEMPETASRLRGRIERVLDWAKARGYRSGDNPARWKGGIQLMLPAPTKVRRVEHYAAMPFAEVPAFYRELQAQTGIAAMALRFTILTAARTCETIGMPWAEVDLDAATWTVPAERMKKGEREHRVPLVPSALSILHSMAEIRQGPFVFPGLRADRPLSNMAMAMVRRRMGRADITVHGFRSTFRDWVAECTTHANHVAEMAVAHTIGSKVEAAYRRGDLFEKRRRLMLDWERYCTTPSADRGVVVPLHSAV